MLWKQCLDGVFEASIMGLLRVNNTLWKLKPNKVNFEKLEIPPRLFLYGDNRGCVLERTLKI